MQTSELSAPTRHTRPFFGMTNRAADDTVAVVLAGGKGTRLHPLTRDICKPALPFGAGYRSIDFSLSNCLNSGIGQVGVATQHKPDALLEHLERVWGDAVTGPQQSIAPWRAETSAPGDGYRGTADAVYRNLHLIEELGRRLVLILAGDHVYQMDYRPMLEQHCERGATVTIGCIEVPTEDAHQFGVLTTDDEDRIRRFVEKPRTRAEIPGKTCDRVLASMMPICSRARCVSTRCRRLRLSSSGATCCRGSSARPARSPGGAALRAAPNPPTGVTSGRSTPIGARTWSCSALRLACGSTTPHGRCGRWSELLPGSRPAPRSTATPR
jgi:hypothetical protein